MIVDLKKIARSLSGMRCQNPAHNETPTVSVENDRLKIIDACCPTFKDLFDEQAHTLIKEEAEINVKKGLDNIFKNR